MDAIILVGGLGSRLAPLTLNRAKPLLPINGTPLLEIQLEKLKSEGIKRVVLATSYKSSDFVEYIKSNPIKGLEIFYSFEGEPLGTGGAVRKAYEVLSDNGGGISRDLVVLNGDIISEHSISTQYSEYLENEAELSIHTINVTDPKRYGLILKYNEKNIKAFKEKTVEPEGNEINAGCYIIKSTLIENYINEFKVVSLEREVFPALIKSKVKCVAYLENSTWFDIGTVESYFKANLYAVESVREEYRGLERFSSFIDPSVEIKENVEIKNSIILENVIIEAGSTITSCFIEAEVKIVENSKFKNKYITKSGILELDS